MLSSLCEVVRFLFVFVQIVRLVYGGEFDYPAFKNVCRNTLIRYLIFVMDNVALGVGASKTGWVVRFLIADAVTDNVAVSVGVSANK